MRVKAGNHWRSTQVGAPIEVELTETDRRNIAAMTPDATLYAVFADGETMTPEERLAWMTEGRPSLPSRDVGPEDFSIAWEPPVEISSIARLRVEPGDVLVITTPDRIPPSGRAHFEKWIADRVGPGVRSMVLEGGAALQLLHIGDELAREVVPIYGADGSRIGSVDRAAAVEIGLGSMPVELSVGVTGTELTEIAFVRQPARPAGAAS